MKETILTILTSVITGIILLLITEMINMAWVKPLNNYKELVGEIICKLTYYSNMYTNVYYDENNEKMYNEYLSASDDVRRLASKTRGLAESRYKFQPFVSKKKDLFDISGYLIRISNCFIAQTADLKWNYIENNSNDEKKIIDLLKVKPIIKK